MQAIFIGGLLIATLTLGSYWYQATAHICPTPIHYRLGEIDEQFALSTTTAKFVALKAEQLWESTINRDLFTYDDEAKFTINFIYDERQQRSDTEEGWHISLDKKQAENEQLIANLKQLGEEYQEARTRYEEERGNYEKRLDLYNAKVEAFNAEGGAPKETFEELQAEAESLANVLDNLTKQEKDLSRQAEEINRLGEEGNKEIATYNAEVEEYNAMFGKLETFTQGDFERERINVYKFDTEDELVAVLEHEFGHALGIGHVASEGSIMYYLRTKRSTSTLSIDDKNAYFSVCDTRITASQKVRQFIRMLLTKV